MRRDSILHTLTVAVVLCIVCSVVVSFLAVFLRDIQEANRLRDMRRNILEAAGLYDEEQPINDQFEQFETRIVELESGEYTDAVDPVTFDATADAKSKDIERAVEIPREHDLAGLGWRSKRAAVYLVRDGDAIKQIVLPISGKGLWSTLYGFLSIDADLKTVKGLTFYDHKETPGLGGEVDNPSWKAQWPGKRLFDDSWNISIQVLKGKVDPGSPTAASQVDGLSGATITTKGVDQLLEYWLGDHGFGTYLNRIRSQG